MTLYAVAVTKWNYHDTYKSGHRKNAKCGCAGVEASKMRMKTVDTKCRCVGKMWRWG